jgi:hypothetical protein
MGTLERTAEQLNYPTVERIEAMGVGAQTVELARMTQPEAMYESLLDTIKLAHYALSSLFLYTRSFSPDVYQNAANELPDDRSAAFIERFNFLDQLGSLRELTVSELDGKLMDFMKSAPRPVSQPQAS